MSAEARPGLRLGGIGDEAAGPIDGQIGALRRLGWRVVELRTVDGVALADLDGGAFRAVADAVHTAGLEVVCLDSRIGDWAHPIDGPFDTDRAELEILAERAATLGCRHIRVMSWPGDGRPEREWRNRVLGRARRLAEIAERRGVVLLHENCSGWAGTDPERVLELLAAVDSPALRLLFDTGNGVPHGYLPADMLRETVGWVAHVHVKDAVRVGDEVRYTPPGDGRADVAGCLRMLLRAGYTGVLSIEPHLAAVPHLGVRAGAAGDAAVAADAFVHAGDRLRDLLAGLDHPVPAGGTG